MRTNITDRNLDQAPTEIKTALRTAARDDRLKYVAATAYGFKINNQPPPGSDRYYEIHPDGTLYLTDEREESNGSQEET